MYGREKPPSLPLFSLLEGGGLKGTFPWEFLEEWDRLREGTPIVIKLPSTSIPSLRSFSLFNRNILSGGGWDLLACQTGLIGLSSPPLDTWQNFIWEAA